jgi:arylsulfatase A-like enzyme
VRILFVDVDALRPDHLGCYGYPRDTSPTIDRLASEGRRFDRCYVSDAPCLPSRTALTTGRFGIRNGAVTHGGVAADPTSLGPYRSFRTHPDYRPWFQALRDAGLRCTSVSSFPSRHGAWWYLAGLNEWHDPGGNGDERAEEVNALAEPWLEAHAREDDWFLHVNYWDAHTTYRTPHEDGDPWSGAPATSWLDQATIDRHWESYGPMSAQDGSLAWFGWRSPLPWVPEAIRTTDDHQRWLDGYDAGIRWMDDHLGRLIAVLEREGVLDQTLIVVTADHGESQGELNVYGDHQTADEATCRVPLIVRWPGRLEPGVDAELRYQMDLAASTTLWAGAEPPAAWDARPLADASGRPTPGRPELILSQMAWSCQRAVRVGRHLCVRTYDAGLKDLPDTLLFDVEADPHELHDLASERPDVVADAVRRLEAWHADAMEASLQEVDPMRTVLAEGGPFHVRGEKERYLARLRATGRHDAAERLAARGGA